MRYIKLFEESKMSRTDELKQFCIENPDTGGLYNMTLATFGKLVENSLIKREKEDSNFIWVLNN